MQPGKTYFVVVVLLTLSVQIIATVDQEEANDRDDVLDSDLTNKTIAVNHTNVNGESNERGDNHKLDLNNGDGVIDEEKITIQENQTVRHRHRNRHNHHHHHHHHHHRGHNNHSEINEDNPSEKRNETIDNEAEVTAAPAIEAKTNKSDNHVKPVKEVDVRTEMIKAELLQKLGLDSPPIVDGPLHPLPDDFYMGEKFTVNDEPNDEEDEYEIDKVKTRQIFVFGSDVTNLCLKKRGAGCYSFNISDQGIYPEDVSSVELWIYKQADPNDHHIQTFVVSELSKHVRYGEEYLRSRNIVKRVETRLKYGWMKIYVNRMVLRWLSKPQRNNGLAVVCKTCKRRGHKTIFGDKDGMMPFLVFYMNRRKTKPRSKRMVRCLEGGDNCCHKERLEINFRDIGWDYIMAPPRITPNFCTGSCNGIHSAYYNHTRLVQTLQQSVMNDYTPIKPCCSPVHFRRTQSLLYIDDRGVIRKIDIPDLIVGECGCT